MTSAARLSERILPNSINVGASAGTVDKGRRDVLRAGGSEFTIDLTGVSTTNELVAAWRQIFAIPWPISGINSVISVGSELGWIPGTRNFWINVTGIDGVPSSVLEDLSVAIPNIIDRMRSGGANYTVALPPSPRTDELLTLLAIQNRDLAIVENDPHTNDTHPITVVDHRGTHPRLAGSAHHFDAVPLLANAVHLQCPAELVRESRLALHAARDEFYLLDLTDARSPEDLLDRCGDAFGLPSRVTELSELLPTEPSQHGWSWRRFSITLVTNLDSVPHPLLQRLTWLLAGRVDRIRAHGEGEAVIFVPTRRSGELRALLEAENRALDALGSATGGAIFPIPVIDHGEADE